MNSTALSTGTVLAGGNPTPESGAGTVLSDRILTEKELCAYANIRPRSAQRWRVIGTGPRFIRIGVRRVGYRLRDVDSWLAERTFRSVADELARSGVN